LLKKEKTLNIIHILIKAIVFIINVIASAIGGNINYRWWTITTTIIITFDVYINKLKDDAAYGSKIELHRSMTDECVRFNEMFDSADFAVESSYKSLIEKSSKLHIDPKCFDLWEEEFKKRNIKEVNAFDVSGGLNKELDVIINQTVIVNNPPDTYSPRTNNPPITNTTTQLKNKKADFELQALFNNLNTKDEDL
jgi:hypothetical protein